MKAETHFISFPASPVSEWMLRREKGHSMQQPAPVLSVLRSDVCDPDQSDTECLDRIICEDRSAFRQLFEKYYKELYYYARKQVQSPDACKDILQDVFSYLWEKRAQIEINQSVRAYLYKAVHHRCVNYLKKAENDFRHLNNFHLQQNTAFLSSNDSAHPFHEKELLETVDQAIEQLPEQCRKIFMLSRKEGLRHKEIASKLSISPKTVEVQIYRALKYLKQQLIFTGKQNNE